MIRQWKYPHDDPAGQRPSIGPMSDGIATKAIARTSSDCGKVRTMVSRPTGTIIAPPMPCRMRKATSRWRSVEMPHRSEPSVKMPMADEKTRRVPNRSATQPLSGMKTATLSV